jgi:hypothetical protein
MICLETKKNIPRITIQTNSLIKTKTIVITNNYYA